METNPTKDNAPLAGEAKAKQLETIRDQYKGESCHHQGLRLLEALCHFTISTFEARRHLDVMHPAGRIQELHEAGNEIDTLRVSVPSDIGRPHCIALYVLRSEVTR